MTTYPEADPLLNRMSENESALLTVAREGSLAQKMSEEENIRNRVLIAEDDPVSRRILKASLVKWGYRVQSVSDGLEALRILEGADPPPLAILDWMMPGLEGPQVCQRVREYSGRPYVYVLLLTARSKKGDLLRGLEAGADDYLTKPFDAQELRARLNVGRRILDLQKSLITAREELRFHATHDLLTGIANRGVALQALHQERARQVREGSPFGTILADIDHFKEVNDRYGHLCGDEVLREVSHRIKECVRPFDTVGRFGGEEFLVVAPLSDGPGTLLLAERIRKAIESLPVSTESGEIYVTASFGVAASNRTRPLEPQSLLQFADDALYQAKKHGRNCSELAAAERITRDSADAGHVRVKSGLR